MRKEKAHRKCVCVCFPIRSNKKISYVSPLFSRLVRDINIKDRIQRGIYRRHRERGEIRSNGRWTLGIKPCDFWSTQGRLRYWEGGLCEKNHKEDLMVVKPDLGLVNLSMCGGLRRGKVSPSLPAKRDESRLLVDEVSQGSECCREHSHL